MQQFTICAALHLLLFTVATFGRVAPGEHRSPLPHPNENSTETDDTKSELEKSSNPIILKMLHFQAEDLCVRTHNNTAFMGIEPFSRIRLDSASDCRKSCLETYPKCVGVMFYYVHSGDENQKHICYLFDKNSVNEEVALVPEKPSSPLDMVRALEVVLNCHEFDPVPPLEEHFVMSSDNVPLKKRDVGFDRPVIGTGPWTRWSVCSPTNRIQLRTQPCEYGRLVQRRRCYTTAGGLGGSVVSAGSGVAGVSGVSGVSGMSGVSGVSGVSGMSGVSGVSGVSGMSGVSGVSGVSGMSGVSGVSGVSGISGVSGVSGVSGMSGVSGVSGVSGISGVSGVPGASVISAVQPTATVSIAVPYPPLPYSHPTFQTSEYARIMAQHQEQMQKLCCYRQHYVHQQLQNQYQSAAAAGQQVHYAVPAVGVCAKPCAGQYRIVPPSSTGYQVTPTVSPGQYIAGGYQPGQAAAVSPGQYIAGGYQPGQTSAVSSAQYIAGEYQPVEIPTVSPAQYIAGGYQGVQTTAISSGQYTAEDCQPGQTTAISPGQYIAGGYQPGQTTVISPTQYVSEGYQQPQPDQVITQDRQPATVVVEEVVNQTVSHIPPTLRPSVRRPLRP
ncbi:unnamed protein product, partial [Anisakis simplex]|uniref:Properdin (inferred by orthology to a human protein) n=1 Tax=Anisakis simplex TaxID=6269 RepID=A0A0M3K8I9_ANISI